METNNILTIEGTPSRLQEGQLNRAALQALRRIPHLVVSPLSPLAHLQATSERDDPAALLRSWEQDHDIWTWATPALLNPHQAVTLLMGDTDTSILGQYLWEDPFGLLPGIRVGVEPADITVEGPVSSEMVLMGLLETLQLSGLPETDPLRIRLSKKEFWGVLTLLDAYRMALLKNRLLRKGGFPKGVPLALLREAWVLGCSQRDLGWAVTMYATLLPDEVPVQFEDTLPDVLHSLETAGLLTQLLPDEESDSDPIFIFDEALETFFQTLVPSALLFGLVVQTIPQPEKVVYSVLGGWRSSSGIWLADFADFVTGYVELLLVGPHFVATALEALLTEAKTTDYAPYISDTRYHPDFLARALLDTRKPQPMQANPVVTIPAPLGQGKVDVRISDQSPIGTCSHCGYPLLPDAHFCARCGTPTHAKEAVVPVCTACGTPLREGVNFCTKCGLAVH